MLGLATYGGRVNAVAPDATASSQRGAILDIACNTGWLDPNDAAKNLAWVRGFYAELFADTGGVPVPGDRYEGVLINHPDTDLADPALNRSGVPWPTLYYKSNYPRLPRIKAQWDPRDIFLHALSVRALLRRNGAATLHPSGRHAPERDAGRGRARPSCPPVDACGQALIAGRRSAHGIACSS
jgi:aclacinomycin oxidase